MPCGMLWKISQWGIGLGGDELRLNELWKNIIAGNAGMSERQFLQREIQDFMASKGRKDILNGRRYYLGDHDILLKRRTAIAENGVQIDLPNLPNNRIVDNKFDDLVDQKVNYLLANPLEVRSDIEELDTVFNRSFHRKLNNIAQDALIGGRGYLYPYFDLNGKLQFKRLKPENVLPFWSDEEHEQLDAFMYLYNMEVYGVGGMKEIQTFVEFYTKDKVSYYKYYNGTLTPNLERADDTYINVDGVAYSWCQVPLICFKNNDVEQPLICRVKCLQDALNAMYSSFADNMEEDVHNTILVIKNYDGEDLAQFRRNLATFGAVKVRTVDGVDGGVDTLTVDVNSSNYEFIMKALKTSIIENGRGFDAKDDRMSNNPNQMNIQSMYSDIDLDANQMEMQFQASLEKIIEFVNVALNLKGKTPIDNIEFIFNRNTPVNEADTINNCKNSVGIISTETIIANHPWTINTDEEIEKLKAERDEQMQLIDYVTQPQGGEVDE